MAPKYPEFEPRGNSLRRWMERADEPGCPISRTELTLSNMDPDVCQWLKPKMRLHFGLGERDQV
ncbi:hypothetical protein N7517_002757 [Penicillium concentricum]|uniref:Uncharacterized protein n=1 Tax=Penicillium concentricum TaxID=293559 RepID=A0A9W9SUQ4_9EURO|nr:uncharacterized protein N7517_002757 [Penicillium concentricum]KAJ5384846.1 hypothetical protein N7517_002757 [Penicillium concentricum]